MQSGSVGGEDSNAGVGQHMQTEHAQSFDVRHSPLQGHLLLAARQHGVQAAQDNDDVIIGHP